MKKPNYLARLNLAARWMLPPGEADEVVADYADLLEGDHRTDEALCQDFGRPWKAVSLLRQPKAYRNWLILFCLMAACLFIPMCSICLQWYNTYGIPAFFQNEFILLGAAFLLALLGYRRFGAKKQRLSPAFPALAVFLVLLGACMELLTIALSTPPCLQWMAQLEIAKAGHLGQCTGTFLELTALFSVLTGLWALVRARVCDRRWRALYVLAVTVLIAALLLLRILRNMTLDVPDHYIWDQLIKITQIMVLGLIGAGVSLC